MLGAIEGSTLFRAGRYLQHPCLNPFILGGLREGSCGAAVIAFLCFLMTLPAILCTLIIFALWQANVTPEVQSGSGSSSPSGSTS
jgi:hypothetical protein